jgi:hypothetical protein
MAEPIIDHSLYAECLAAMAASGDGFPCDTLAPRGLLEFTMHDRSAAFAAADGKAPEMMHRRERI